MATHIRRSADKRSRDYRWSQLRVEALRVMGQRNMQYSELGAVIGSTSTQVSRWLCADSPVSPSNETMDTIERVLDL